MNNKILKYPICRVRGHNLNNSAIIDAGDCGFMKQCSRCGRYVVYAKYVGTLDLSEKEAMQFKQEYEDELDFPSLIKIRRGSDDTKSKEKEAE